MTLEQEGRAFVQAETGARGALDGPVSGTSRTGSGFGTLYERFEFRIVADIFV